jgi:HK97 family phage major capsid protein
MKISKLSKILVFTVAAIIAGGLFGSFVAAAIGGITVAALPVLGAVDYNTAIKEKNEQLAEIKSEMRDLINLAEVENRDFDEKEDKRFKELEKQAGQIDERIARLEKLENLNAGTAQQQKKKKEKEEGEERRQKLETAFRDWMVYGDRGLSDEQRALLKEQRDLNTSTDAQGGVTVPTGFAEKIEIAMKKYGRITKIADVMPTATGNDIDYPTVNDTENEGEMIGENTSADKKEPSFGSVKVKAYTFSSGIVPISNQLLQDNAVGLDQRIADMLVIRNLNAFNRKAILGTGTEQPQGVSVAAPKGVEAAVSSVTFDDLVDLMHSVDEVYRENAVWLLNDTTLKAIKKLKDADGRPLWMTSLADGTPATILGKSYVTNNFMPGIGAGNKSILFGDFKKYLVRQVQGASVKRLEERFAEKNQTAFILFTRLDGKLIDAGTNPIKALQHAAA